MGGERKDLSNSPKASKGRKMFVCCMGGRENSQELKKLERGLVQGRGKPKGDDQGKNVGRLWSLGVWGGGSGKK